MVDDRWDMASTRQDDRLDMANTRQESDQVVEESVRMLEISLPIQPVDGNISEQRSALHPRPWDNSGLRDAKVYRRVLIVYHRVLHQKVGTKARAQW